VTGVQTCALPIFVDGAGLPVPKARVTAVQNGAVWFAGETDERGMLIVALRGGGKVALVAERGDRYAAAEL
jgi:septal ring factor EnvC (AmiA/AmiB activator)